MGIRNKVSKPVLTEIELPEGVELVIGHEKIDVGHLDGRSAKLLLPRVVGGDVIDNTRRSVEWVLKTEGSKSFEVGVVARCPRAGTHRRKLVLA